MNKLLKFFLWFVFGLVAIVLLLALLGAREQKPKIADVFACHAKGIRYYSEIGSYPSLSDGRSAKMVIDEKCARSVSAFGAP